MNKAKTGRPRSEKAQEAILDATHDLLNETSGSGLSIEAIARRAGVGKPTIYRWWPSLADIVLETLLRQADADIGVPPFTTLRETLGEFLRLSVQSINRGSGVHLRYLMAQAQQDEGFSQRFRETFTAQRRATLKSIFNEAIKRKEIGPDQDLDLLVDMVFGAMWFRLLIGHAVMDERFAHGLTEVMTKLGITNKKDGVAEY